MHLKHPTQRTDAMSEENNNREVMIKYQYYKTIGGWLTHDEWSNIESVVVEVIDETDDREGQGSWLWIV